MNKGASSAISIRTPILRRSRTSMQYFLFTVTLDGTNIWMKQPASRYGKKLWPLSWFFYLLVRTFFSIEIVACATPYSASCFQGRIKKKLPHPLWPSKKIQFSFEPFKHFCRYFISTRISSSLRFFGAIFAHTVFIFKSRVTIWRIVHSSI
jgi:hypothetical protein